MDRVGLPDFWGPIGPIGVRKSDSPRERLLMVLGRAIARLAPRPDGRKSGRCRPQGRRYAAGAGGTPALQRYRHSQEWLFHTPPPRRSPDTPSHRLSAGELRNMRDFVARAGGASRAIPDSGISDSGDSKPEAVDS